MSGAYLPASLSVCGPVVWMRPTPLSAKSDALMTRPQGERSRLSATCSRYCSFLSRPGCQTGLVTARTSSATRGPNRSASTANAASRSPPGASSAA